MKLSQWAKEQGISYTTAWRWCRQGRMPCEWRQLPSGTIIVAGKQLLAEVKVTYVYARVSSGDKKADLIRQADRCSNFCAAAGWPVTKVVTEVASGMNDNRKKLQMLLDMPAGRLVVEHKDRLTRFGFNYFDKLLPKLGWELVVINRSETDSEDLIKDLISIVTSFCCRLYGLRRGQRKAQEIRKTCEEPAS